MLVGCVVLAFLVAGYAGSRFDPPAPVPPAGSIRLGPEPGESVAGYLARLPADLPPAGVVVPALVQLTGELDAADALVAVAGTEPSQAVFRVPIRRVQTALRFLALEPQVPAATALESARDRALGAAAADAQRLTGRPAAVAAAEATALARPCACVLAMVVRGDRAALDVVRARPGVRAVQGAPAGSTDRELALSPLLPEQVERADPLPDDGPVPG